MGYQENLAGFGFASVGGSFAIGSFVAGLLCDYIHRNHVIMIGITGLIGAVVCVGPSQVL